MEENKIISATVRVCNEYIGRSAEARIEENEVVLWEGEIEPTYGDADSYAPQIEGKLQELGYNPGRLELITMVDDFGGISGWIR